jgi:hypothetical protein
MEKIRFAKRFFERIKIGKLQNDGNFSGNSQNFTNFEKREKSSKFHKISHSAKTTYLATNFYEDDTLFQNSRFSLSNFMDFLSVFC